MFDDTKSCFQVLLLVIISYFSVKSQLLAKTGEFSLKKMFVYISTSLFQENNKLSFTCVCFQVKKKSKNILPLK